ncbi:hypothetical protein Ddc_10533 [Ditylenchus destructor]|nr:hypothetical protein Ddc_10533 [Ditylenchus destructor]
MNSLHAITDNRPSGESAPAETLVHSAEADINKVMTGPRSDNTKQITLNKPSTKVDSNQSRNPELETRVGIEKFIESMWEKTKAGNNVDNDIKTIRNHFKNRSK